LRLPADVSIHSASAKTALARVIREEKSLPVTDDEADSLARLLEASKDDEEFLANTVSAVRFLLDRLELSIPAK
jgi:hypothetical protein